MVSWILRCRAFRVFWFIGFIDCIFTLLIIKLFWGKIVRFRGLGRVMLLDFLVFRVLKLKIVVRMMRVEFLWKLSKVIEVTVFRIRDAMVL